jgi:hypothetical protein
MASELLTTQQAAEYLSVGVKNLGNHWHVWGLHLRHRRNRLARAGLLGTRSGRQS